MSGISLNQFRSVALEKESGDLRVSSGAPDRLVNKGTLGSRIATFFESIGRALGLIADDTRTLRQQQAIRGFSDSLKDHYGPEVANRALREARLIDDHGGLDPEEGPHGLVKDLGADPVNQEVVGRRGEIAVIQVAPPLQSLTGRVVLQILDKAETLRRETLERVEEIARDSLPGGQTFEALKHDPALQELGLGGTTPQEVLDEYAIRLRERFRLECDSGRRPIAPNQITVELTEARLKAVAREVMVDVLTDVMGEGTELRQGYQKAMSTLLDRVIEDAGPEDLQQAIEEAQRALKQRQEISGRVGGVRNEKSEMGVTFGDEYIMQQTLIAELEKRIGNGGISRETLEKVQQRILEEGSSLRQVRDQNGAPLKDDRSLDPETERDEVKQRQKIKDRARALTGPPVALVGALSRVLGSVTNLRGNDIGTFTGRR